MVPNIFRYGERHKPLGRWMILIEYIAASKRVGNHLL